MLAVVELGKMPALFTRMSMRPPSTRVASPASSLDAVGEPFRSAGNEIRPATAGADPLDDLGAAFERCVR